jgi:hypothetical protein
VRQRGLCGTGESARLIPPGPLGSSQCPPRIGKAPRPVQWQPRFFGLALQHGVHRPIARSRWNAPGRNVGMSLERQLHDTKPMPNEDCGSVLPDVAERAKEVIPVQHPSRATLPALIAGSLFQYRHAGDIECRMAAGAFSYIPRGLVDLAAFLMAPASVFSEAAAAARHRRMLAIPARAHSSSCS